MKLSKTMLALLAGCLGITGFAVRFARSEPDDAPSVAAPATQPTTQPELLAEEFRSAATGIAFRPPVGSQEVTTSVPDQIVEFDNEQRHWVFKASRVSLSQPLPLNDYKDQFGQQHDGLMEITSKKLQEQPSAQVLMKQVVHVGDDTPVGILAVRYSDGLQWHLLHQAIVAPKDARDRFYYVLEFNTPGHRAVGNEVNDEERQADATFNQVVDTVRILDTDAIYQDQADRLIRTRGLFANWTPKYLASRLIPLQYFRLLRDGKDIGYTVEANDLDTREGRIAGVDTLKVGVRSHTEPDPKSIIDADSCLLVTVDQKHETWANIATLNIQVEGKPQLSKITEVGSSDAKIQAVASGPPAGGLAAPIDPRQPKPQPWIQMQESRPLNVTRTVTRKDKEATLPTYLPTFSQQLPSFYIPQGISYLLPRLLPFHQTNTYLFATYVAAGNNGEPAIMLRYIDILPPAEVTLGGKAVLAMSVKDHVGLEGPVTTHYIDPKTGAFLGSVSTMIDKDKQSHTITILPTDEATLQKLWNKPNLSKPASTIDDAQQNQLSPGH